MATNPGDEATHAVDEGPFTIPRIEQMVHRFYERVRDDPSLGPVFEKRIDDWPFHLERMVRFWRAILRSDGSFTMSPRGGPPLLHRQIDELAHHHFDRWIAVFGEVVDDLYEPEAAERVKQAAGRIRVNLSRHLPPDEGSEGEHASIASGRKESCVFELVVD